MDTPVYTLLIVESPTIAGIIQKICPPSVYVLSTDGFCWRPKYDFSNHQIKAVADPDKLSIRNELKEQSGVAGTIVVAADSDASGDFIAWSVNRFLKSSNIKRGRLQSLSKPSILSMLSETSELDESRLETKLKNHFLIQRMWPKHAGISDIQLAGLIAVFGAEPLFSSFLDENKALYRSTTPLQCPFDEWISVRAVRNSGQYHIEKPLSTFDVVEYINAEKWVESCHDAQLLLQQLFQTLLQFSDASLISYPRTSTQAFYSDTWTHMRQQLLKKGSVNKLKPVYLQEIAGNECPHESIHPIDLSLKPDFVTGELPKNIGKLYGWIYEHTVKSLSMPELLETSFVSDLNPDAIFHPGSHPSNMRSKEKLHETLEGKAEHPQSLRPCLTLSELGIRMAGLGVVKPSNFGKTVDEWISKGWIGLKDRVATPGKEVLKNLGHAASFHQKLKKLNRIKEKNTLTRETVVDIITS